MCFGTKPTCRLRVGVPQARSEHANPHLALAGLRQWSVGHFEAVDIAELPDLNGPIA
jgi:hypothetical protein